MRVNVSQPHLACNMLIMCHQPPVVQYAPLLQPHPAAPRSRCLLPACLLGKHQVPADAGAQHHRASWEIMGMSAPTGYETSAAHLQHTAAIGTTCLAQKQHNINAPSSNCKKNTCRPHLQHEKVLNSRPLLILLPMTCITCRL
jgi:hypothetical protein